MTTAQTLHGWGTLPWEQIVEILGDAEAAWADYEGFHIGRCPMEVPPYSHLWAWSPKWRFRIRIDGDSGVVAALGDAAAPPGAPTLHTREVAVHQYPAIPWAGDAQISVGASRLIETIGQITLTETLEPMPMTFVTVGTPT